MTSNPHWFEPPPPESRRLLSTIGTRRVAVVSQSGGGKTFALMRLLELLYEKSSPFVVIDPVGKQALAMALWRSMSRQPDLARSASLYLTQVVLRDGGRRISFEAEVLPPLAGEKLA